MSTSSEPHHTLCDHRPLRGLWQSVRRYLHRNSSIAVFVCNEQGHYDKVTVAHDETELSIVWDSLVLPAAAARREVWITDIGNLMVD